MIDRGQQHGQVRLDVQRTEADSWELQVVVPERVAIRLIWFAALMLVLLAGSGTLAEAVRVLPH